MAAIVEEKTYLLVTLMLTRIRSWDSSESEYYVKYSVQYSFGNRKKNRSIEKRKICLKKQKLIWNKSNLKNL